MGVVDGVELVEVGEGAPARGRGDKLPFVCTHSKCDFHGDYTLENIQRHLRSHREQDAKDQAARDKREADRKLKEEAHGHKKGKGKRKFTRRYGG